MQGDSEPASRGDERGNDRSRELRTVFLSGWIALLGLSGAGAVSAVRILYQTFYQRVGISVDDVGQSNWRLLVVPVIDLGAYVALAFPGVVVGWIIRSWLVRSSATEGQPDSNAPLLKSRPLVFLLNDKFWTWLFSRLPKKAGIEIASVFVTIGLGILSSVLVTPVVRASNQPLILLSLSGLATLLLIFVFALLGGTYTFRAFELAAVAVVVSVGLWTSAYDSATAAGLTLMDDGTTSSKGRFAMQFLDVPISQACITWLDQPVVDPSSAGTFDASRPVLILGQSGGFVVLYSSGRPIRVPAGRIEIIGITPDEAHGSCKSVTGAS